jgi:isoleucyl-tRNA synthetase
MAETTYQNLVKFLPPSKEDVRSVHFVSSPEVKREYFNEEVERSVGRMQAVIELGRFIRDQKTISLKTPCRKLIIINPDQQYHQDIKSLESYIQEELNVREVLVTADEDSYGVNYRLVPDAKALGLKFKKDASKIKSALPSVSISEIKSFLKSGLIEIAGFPLTPAELQVARTFDNSKHPHYHAQFTNEVLVILDTQLDEGLLQEGLAREVINRVQRLRKKAELEATDDVVYHYQITQDENSQLKSVMVDQVELLRRYLKQDLIIGETKGEKLIMEEEQEVNGSKFMLGLMKH